MSHSAKLSSGIRTEGCVRGSTVNQWFMSFFLYLLLLVVNFCWLGSMHTEAVAFDVVHEAVDVFDSLLLLLLLLLFKDSLEPVLPIENFTFELLPLGIFYLRLSSTLMFCVLCEDSIDRSINHRKRQQQQQNLTKIKKK